MCGRARQRHLGARPGPRRHAGLLTPLACAAAILVMLMAGVLVHRPNGFLVFRDGYEYVLLISVLGIAVVATAGLLATFYWPQPASSPALAGVSEPAADGG